MQDGTLVPFVVSMICLMAIASMTAMLLKRIRFPYTIGLVLAGLLVGLVSSHVHVPFFASLQSVRVTPDVIVYVLLPPLVFDAALNIDSRLLMKNLRPILLLAVPGLLVATVVTGFGIAVFTPVSVGSALIFGALISATDPVAVVALFKEMGAPRRLTMLIDGESLFNDATAMVAFQILVGIVTVGVWSGAAIAKGFVDFFLVFGGGALVGAAVAYVATKTFVFAKNDPLIVISVTSLTAYASFVLANYYLNFSGVMAAVGAGMVINRHGSKHFTSEVKQYNSVFWSYACFLANSIIFLVIGFTEEHLIADLFKHPFSLLYIFAAIAVVLAARAVVVFGCVPVFNLFSGKNEPVDYKERIVLFWGGLRGALPIALAASLAYDFPDRNFILQLTCGIVLFTLLVQGTSIKRVVTMLNMEKEEING